MNNGNDRRSFKLAVEKLMNVVLGVAVERSRGYSVRSKCQPTVSELNEKDGRGQGSTFVQDDDLAVSQQCTGNGEQLELASR